MDYSILICAIIHKLIRKWISYSFSDAHLTRHALLSFCCLQIVHSYVNYSSIFTPFLKDVPIFFCNWYAFYLITERTYYDYTYGLRALLKSNINHIIQQCFINMWFLSWQCGLPIVLKTDGEHEVQVVVTQQYKPKVL